MDSEVEFQTTIFRRYCDNYFDISDENSLAKTSLPFENSLNMFFLLPLKPRSSTIWLLKQRTDFGQKYISFTHKTINVPFQRTAAQTFCCRLISKLAVLVCSFLSAAFITAISDSLDFRTRAISIFAL